MKNNKLLLSAVLLGSLVLGGTTSVNATATGGTVTTKGKIQFVDGKGDDKTNPTDPGDKGDPKDKDPKDPVTPVDPGGKTDGPLKFVYVPNIDFGTNNTLKTTGNAYYYSKFTQVKTVSDKVEDRINYFEVNDSRGGGKGWEVTLSNDGVFQNSDGHKIKANLYFNDLNIKSNSNMEDKYYPSFVAFENKDTRDAVNSTNYLKVSNETGAAISLVKADSSKKEGFGSWTTRFGTMKNQVEQEVADNAGNLSKEKRNPAIALEVLPGMKDTETAYTTELVWTIQTAK